MNLFDQHEDTITKPTNGQIVTLQAVVVGENDDGTKTIQYLDKNKKPMTTVHRIPSHLIQSSAPFTRAPSKQALVLSLWFRGISKNEDYEYLMDDAVRSLILLFCAYNISIRLTRPLSLGTNRDMHHLHIRQIRVFSKCGLLCPLTFHDASPCVKRGHILESKCRDPKGCIDGDLDTYTHNDYSNRIESNSESHWMEFNVDNTKCGWIDSVHDIDNVVIYNRLDGCNVRTIGCILELKNDDKTVTKWTLKGVHDEYRLQC